MGKIVVDRRPWGSFERFTLNERTTVKLLYVKRGRRLSYQYHNRRSEFWKVVKGRIRVTLGKRSIVLAEGDTIKIPLKAKHRIEGLKDSVVLEIAHGRFGENDIVRISDDYKRAGA